MKPVTVHRKPIICARAVGRYFEVGDPATRIWFILELVLQLANHTDEFLLNQHVSVAAMHI